jgi:hypothetical protein
LTPDLPALVLFGVDVEIEDLSTCHWPRRMRAEDRLGWWTHAD